MERLHVALGDSVVDRPLIRDDLFLDRRVAPARLRLHQRRNCRHRQQHGQWGNSQNS